MRNSIERDISTRKRVLRSEGGFTIMELLAASSLGLVLLTLALAATLSGKQVLNFDFERTKLLMNNRSSLDLLGIDIRLSGERLPRGFPAVEIIDGVSGATDQIIVRRSLVSEVLTLCSAIAAGSSTSQVIFATGDGTVAAGVQSSGCVFGDEGQDQNYTAWSGYRVADGGTSRPAYIYDISTGNGEFFTYSGEGSTSTSYFIERGSGVWQNDYQYISSSIYLLEEHRYRVVDNRLQLIEDGDFSGPLTIATKISDFQITATFADGSTVTELLPTSGLSWADIRFIEVTFAGQEQYQGSPMTRSLSGRFFPRNVLSN